MHNLVKISPTMWIWGTINYLVVVARKVSIIVHVAGKEPMFLSSEIWSPTLVCLNWVTHSLFDTYWRRRRKKGSPVYYIERRNDLPVFSLWSKVLTPNWCPLVQICVTHMQDFSFMYWFDGHFANLYNTYTGFQLYVLVWRSSFKFVWHIYRNSALCIGLRVMLQICITHIQDFSFVYWFDGHLFQRSEI